MAPLLKSAPQTKSAAQAKVRPHVEPKACFVWHLDSKRGWGPIEGTGCAHYVSHELDITGRGLTCEDGYLVRVADLVARLHRTTLDGVGLNDVWVTDDQKHCGIVIGVDRSAPGKPTITIRHASSKLERVSTNDWATYFGGTGKFYRSPASVGGMPERSSKANTSIMPFGGRNGEQ